MSVYLSAHVWVARQPPGFAFVEFEDPRDGEDALRAMNNKELFGCLLRVEESKGKGKGGKGKGDDRGGGGSYDGPRGGGYGGGACDCLGGLFCAFLIKAAFSPPRVDSTIFVHSRPDCGGSGSFAWKIWRYFCFLKVSFGNRR